MLTDDMTMILIRTVISVCIALFTAYVVPYIEELRQDKRYGSVINMIILAVKAAEQQFKEPGQGKAKKAEVIRFVSDWLAKNGIKVTDEELSQLIEAAVYQMKQENKHDPKSDH